MVISVKRRVAILISGRGSNMAALIEAAQGDGLSGRDRAGDLQPADAGGLAIAQAQRHRRPQVIESKPFGKDRAAFEAALQAALDAHRIELICLGGFMRLLTAEFVAALARPDAQHPSVAAAVVSRASIRTARRCAPA